MDVFTNAEQIHPVAPGSLFLINGRKISTHGTPLPEIGRFSDHRMPKYTASS